MTRFNTQLVHGLPVGDNNTGAVNPPIYNSTTYAFEKVDAMPRYDYARSGNPTRDFLEQQIAEPEQGTRGFAFASGLAAIHAVLSIFKPGDRIVVGDNIYGGIRSSMSSLPVGASWSSQSIPRTLQRWRPPSRATARTASRLRKPSTLKP